MDADEEIKQVLRERFSDGELFTVTMVARASGASPQDVTSVLASLEGGELLFQGRMEFRDADGKLVGPAYCYRYVGGGPFDS